MKIEIWSDYACPFCYVGKRHLESALTRFAQAQEVQIIHRAFELDPNASPEVTGTTQARIAKKYGKSLTGALDMIRYIENAGKSAGFTMNYETTQYTNTFDAHRLTKLAEMLGKVDEINERLMKAYFTENLALAKPETLIKCAEDVGIERELVEKMLNSDQFKTETRADEQLAHQMGVQGVPFFVIDEKFAISGAQPVEQFVTALNQAYAESNRAATIHGETCGIDGCY